MSIRTNSAAKWLPVKRLKVGFAGVTYNAVEIKNLRLTFSTVFKSCVLIVEPEALLRPSV